ncbi:MAG: hypothetical protein ABIJ09_21310 [Pseudomonadota bacterium]
MHQRVSLARPGLVIALLASLGSSGCFGLFGSADSYCSEWASLMCANMIQCCSSRQRESLLAEDNVNDEGRCKQDMELLCRSYYAEPIYSVSEGRSTFNKETAAACFDASRPKDGKCVIVAEESPMAEPCSDSPFEGAQGSGEECFWDFECAVDTVCIEAKCKALAKKGESCGSLGCASGLFCDGGQCASLKGSGTACNSSYECAENLICDGTCKARLGAGQTCSADVQCESSECGLGACGDGSACQDDGDCVGQCGQGGGYCQDASDCSNVCSSSGTTCYSAGDCTAPQSCDADTCSGATCGSRSCQPMQPREINYCPLGSSSVPLP